MSSKLQSSITISLDEVLRKEEVLRDPFGSRTTIDPFELEKRASPYQDEFIVTLDALERIVQSIRVKYPTCTEIEVDYSDGFDVVVIEPETEKMFLSRCEEAQNRYDAALTAYNEQAEYTTKQLFEVDAYHSIIDQLGSLSL